MGVRVFSPKVPLAPGNCVFLISARNFSECQGLPPSASRTTLCVRTPPHWPHTHTHGGRQPPPVPRTHPHLGYAPQDSRSSRAPTGAPLSSAERQPHPLPRSGATPGLQDPRLVWLEANQSQWRGLHPLAAGETPGGPRPASGQDWDARGGEQASRPPGGRGHHRAPLLRLCPKESQWAADILPHLPPSPLEEDDWAELRRD